MGPVPKGGWIPTVIAEDGSVEEFPKEQIGNAVIELSDTPDGDIQVKVNWTQPFAYGCAVVRCGDRYVARCPAPAGRLILGHLMAHLATLLL